MVSLSKTPLMRETFAKLFALIGQDFDGNTLCLPHAYALLNIAKQNLANIRKHMVGAKESLAKALVISDLGIISQQIRLLLNRQKISVTATGVDTGVAKHLEKENYDYVILDLPNQVTEMASQIASLPKVLKYLFEFNKMVDEPVQIIVIMNKKDTRLSSLEQLADHVVLKEPGWQSHLEFLLKGV